MRLRAKRRSARALVSQQLLRYDDNLKKKKIESKQPFLKKIYFKFFVWKIFI